MHAWISDLSCFIFIVLFLVYRCHCRLYSHSISNYFVFLFFKPNHKRICWRHVKSKFQLWKVETTIQLPTYEKEAGKSAGSTHVRFSSSSSSIWFYIFNDAVVGCVIFLLLHHCCLRLCDFLSFYLSYSCYLPNFFSCVLLQYQMIATTLKCVLHIV